MKLLPKVLLGSSEELEYLDQCRQLLSLALVHPAFPHEDREALTYWLSRLDEKSRGILERSPAPLLPSSQQRPPPIPPRKIHQLKSEDQTRLSNGGSRIYINGYLSQTTPTQREDSLEQLDGSSLELEDEERGRSNSLGPGQSLYGSSDPPQLPPRAPPSSMDDYIRYRMCTAAGKSNSLPVPRMSSVGALSAPMGYLDELGVQAAAIDWGTGMKGEWGGTVKVCVSVRETSHIGWAGQSKPLGGEPFLGHSSLPFEESSGHVSWSLCPAGR